MRWIMMRIKMILIQSIFIQMFGGFMQPFWRGSGVSTMMSVNKDFIFFENPDNRELQIWSRTENGWDLKITPGTKKRRGFRRKKNHLSKTIEFVFKLMPCASLCSILTSKWNKSCLQIVLFISVWSV